MIDMPKNMTPKGSVVLTINQKISLEREWYFLGCEHARKKTAKEIIEMFDNDNYITEQDLINAIAKKYGVEE